MTALTIRDRVIVTIQGNGDPPVEIAGIVIARTAVPVAVRRASPTPAYDVLTKDGKVLAGVAGTALTRLA